jgi:hypothetical protein
MTDASCRWWVALARTAPPMDTSVCFRPEADIRKAKESKLLHSRETTGSLAGRHSSKQMPFPRNAFKDIAPAVFEAKAGTGNQVLYRV